MWHGWRFRIAGREEVYLYSFPISAHVNSFILSRMSGSLKISMSAPPGSPFFWNPMKKFHGSLWEQPTHQAALLDMGLALGPLRTPYSWVLELLRWRIGEYYLLESSIKERNKKQEWSSGNGSWPRLSALSPPRQILSSGQSQGKTSNLLRMALNSPTRWRQ